MVLDRSERMLGQPLTQLHLFPVLLNSSFHLVQQVFIHPARDAATVFAARTLGFDRALRTRTGRVVLDVPVFLSGLEAEGEHLSGRAQVTVLFEVIEEVFLAEEAMLAAGGGSGLGNEWHDPINNTGFDLLAMVLAYIGQDLKVIHAE